jgi:hypothetical protein
MNVIAKVGCESLQKLLGLAPIPIKVTDNSGQRQCVDAKRGTHRLTPGMIWSIFSFGEAMTEYRHHHHHVHIPAGAR